MVAAGPVRRALSMRGDTICGCSKRKDEREVEGRVRHRALSPVDVRVLDRDQSRFPVSRIQEMRRDADTETYYLLMTA